MKITLTDTDLRILLQHQLGRRARVRSVECADNEIRLRLSVGPLPISVGLRVFEFDGARLQFEIVGGLASKVLTLLRPALERSGADVDGSQIRLTLPESVTRMVRMTLAGVDPRGVHLAGTLEDLSALDVRAPAPGD